MTTPHARLARLLAIRTVALRAASRTLAVAIGSTASNVALARRIGELRGELTPTADTTTGQQLKAATATRRGLQLAAERQTVRLDGATAHQELTAHAVLQSRAASEAVERAIARRETARAQTATGVASAQQAMRKPGR